MLCEEMALTFEETKQLVKVLLKELQNMQMKLDQKPSTDQKSQNQTRKAEIARENVTFFEQDIYVESPETKLNLLASRVHEFIGGSDDDAFSLDDEKEAKDRSNSISNHGK